MMKSLSLPTLPIRNRIHPAAQKALGHKSSTLSFRRPGMTRRVNCEATHLNAGFTLVEMLVVLTIIALVLGLVGPRVLNYLGESRTKTAKLQIESFGSSLDLFYLDTGRYPTSSEGLDALVQRPTGVEIWNGPYVKGGRVPSDPWGHAYLYHSPVERAPYEIVSYGSDGHEGGTGSAADISNVEH
jgi:general secretion pathway protein G